MNEHFLTQEAGSAALNGIICALIYVIYKSHAQALKYFNNNLHSYLRLWAIAESDGHRRKNVREISDENM